MYVKNIVTNISLRYQYTIPLHSNTYIQDTKYTEGMEQARWRGETSKYTYVFSQIHINQLSKNARLEYSEKLTLNTNIKKRAPITGRFFASKFRRHFEVSNCAKFTLTSPSLLITKFFSAMRVYLNEIPTYYLYRAARNFHVSRFFISNTFADESRPDFATRFGPAW